LESQGVIQQFLLFLRITRSSGIIRRYFVVNGFDGALSTLGLVMGFYVGNVSDTAIMFSACFGTAVALGISGVSSAYISEAAEMQKSLAELETSMVESLDGTPHVKAARTMPYIIALVNGLSPFLISLLIVSPLWLPPALLPVQLNPLHGCIVLAFVAIFLLGTFLGKVSGVMWMWSGIKAALVAAVTALLILWLKV
jgi:predicted membrane protein (TIGR00267 family)